MEDPTSAVRAGTFYIIGRCDGPCTLIQLHTRNIGMTEQKLTHHWFPKLGIADRAEFHQTNACRCFLEIGGPRPT